VRNYAISSNTLIHEQFKNFHGELKKLEKALHENDVMLEETKNVATNNIDSLHQKIQNSVTNKLQAVTEKQELFQQEAISQKVRHPQRSWWLDECDRPKGGWTSLKMSVFS